MKGVSADLPERSELAELSERLHEAERSLGARLYEAEKALAAIQRKPAPPAPPEPRTAVLASSRHAAGPAAARWRNLLGAVDEEYFRRELKPGCVVYEGTVTEPLVGNANVMRFAAAGAGVNAHAATQVEQRALWALTRPRLLLWYSSPVGSTNTFSVRFVVRHFAVGNTLSNNVFVVDFTPPGPAVANTELFATVVGTAVMPVVPSPIQLRVGRLGGDANANALDVVLAVVVFEEVA